jgi:transposase
MGNYTAELLGLEDVIVENVYEDGKGCHIEIILPRRKHCCPCCEAMTDRIHDYRVQIVKDLDIHGVHAYLHIKKRRYVCEKCGKKFYEENYFLPRYHRITNRAVGKIINDFRESHTAKDIGKDNNVSGQTALRYFKLVNYSCSELPEVLSIDEFKGDADGEKYQTLLTDAKEHTIIDVLPNRKKSDLIRYFHKFKNRKDVKYVIIDMNSHFKDVVLTCFPNAILVIDRYHVTRQAIWAMENVRKAEQKNLSAVWRKFCKNSKCLLNIPKDRLTEEQREKLRTILGLSTRLEIAYDLKNDFLEFMHSPDSETAKQRLSMWLYHAENSNIPEFKACITAMHNWSEYILNSFDVPYTNGFTEGCNNKIKVLKRVCYGIRNFETFRNRILHCASQP